LAVILAGRLLLDIALEVEIKEEGGVELLLAFSYSVTRVLPLRHLTPCVRGYDRDGLGWVLVKIRSAPPNIKGRSSGRRSLKRLLERPIY
jgi:hypothetical protein